MPVRSGFAEPGSRNFDISPASVYDSSMTEPTASEKTSPVPLKPAWCRCGGGAGRAGVGPAVGRLCLAMFIVGVCRTW